MKTLLIAFILLYPSLVVAQRITAIDMTNDHKAVVLAVREANQVLAQLPNKSKIILLRRYTDPYPLYQISYLTLPWKYQKLLKWAKAKRLLTRKLLVITDLYGGREAGLAEICGKMGVSSSGVILHETGHLLGMYDHTPELYILAPQCLKEMGRCSK